MIKFELTLRFSNKRKMLENIKSVYFIKNLFYNLTPLTQLKIVKYNKSLQNKIDITLMNYKLLSERYIVQEENGKTKEFSLFDNQLLFEGEYLNGKRNGKGKEYLLSGRFGYIDMIFEGEYLNGKRNGKGKLYSYRNDILISEEEYSNGILDGKVKYYKEGLLFFLGEYKKGKPWNARTYDKNNVLYEIKEGNGYIKLYDKYNYSFFEGEYINGIRNGKGKEYNHNGVLFVGEYKDGKRWNGIRLGFNNYVNYILKNGTKYTKDGEEIKEKIFFEGECLNGREIGKFYDYWGNVIFEGETLYNHKIKGKSYDSFFRLQYEGDYQFDKIWNGKGYDEGGNQIIDLHNGKGMVEEQDFSCGHLYYKGEYLNGKRNGKGKEYFGKIEYEGDFLNGEKHGKGIEFFNNNYEPRKLFFEGEYLNGLKWNGKGYDEDGKVAFELNEGNGVVKEFNINTFKLMFEGEYKNGKRNGNGRELYDKTLRFEGKFLDGKRIGKGIEYNSSGDKIIFEGEYLNDKKNGKGREYSEKGNLIFEGEYYNNIKNGKGKEYDGMGNLLFEGIYYNGIKNGRGKEFDKKGNIIFNGYYFNGERII